MRTIYISLGIALLFFAHQSWSQCSSCNLTISVDTTEDLLIDTGTTVCIESGVTLNGNITLNGGALCNNGIINGSFITINEGEFENEGILDLEELIAYEGSIEIDGALLVDQILFDGNLIEFINYGEIDTEEFNIVNPEEFIGGLNMLNFGSINAGLFYMEGLHTFVDGGQFTVTENMTIMEDSFFQANEFCMVQDLLNYGHIQNPIQMEIFGDWINHNIIQGTFEMECGKYIIHGQSENYGSIGTSTSIVDICDLGNPEGGLDINSGDIGPNVSFCECGTSDIDEFSAELAWNLSPVPARDFTNLTVSRLIVNGELKIYNSSGSIIDRIPIQGTSNIEINTNSLNAGIYLFHLTERNHQLVTGKFIVE